MARPKGIRLQAQIDELNARLEVTEIEHEYVGMGHCLNCATLLVVGLTEQRDRLQAEAVSLNGTIARLKEELKGASHEQGH